MASFANTIGGASGGASTGALVAGPWGALGGAAIGGGLGALEDIFGAKNRSEQMNTLRPNQIGLQDSLISQIQALMGGQGGLSPISKSAVQRFNTQTVPGLAERFSSLGSGGSQRSSAFTGALGSAGSGLQQELAGLDMNMLLQLLGPALSQSSENQIYQQGPGFGETFGGAALQQAPQLISAYQQGQNRDKQYGEIMEALKKLGGGQ